MRNALALRSCSETSGTNCTWKIRLEHPERVERLLFATMVLYYDLTLIGADIQKRELRKKICKNKVSLAFLALRALFMT